MKIRTLTDLIEKLQQAKIDYTVKSTGNLFQYKTVTYRRNGNVVVADFHKGGKLIGIWGV